MTSSNLNLKSLPDVPSQLVTGSEHVHGLCIESDSLLTALLCQAIAEEGLENQWLDAIKTALCDFGRYIESKETLYRGIRALRQNLRTAKFERPPLGSDSKSIYHQLQQNKVGKKEVVHVDITAIELEPIPESPRPALSVQSKLKQIQHRILTQTSAETSLPMHLLVAASSSAVPAAGNYGHPLSETRLGREHHAILFEGDVFHFGRALVDHEEPDNASIVYGLENWQGEFPPLYIAGGTFTFKNILCERRFGSLLSILRLSLYVYVSLCLEQSLLHDCHVALQYPPPKIIVFHSPPANPPALSPGLRDEPSQPARNHKSSSNNSGLWHLISRKTESIIHRVSGSSHARSHSEGDHIGIPISSHDIQPFKPGQNYLPNRDTHHHEINRCTDSPSRTLVNVERDPMEVFTASIRRLRDSKCILSTSLQVGFPPPILLRQLASREEEQKSLQVLPSIGSSVSSSISSATMFTNNSIKITGIEKTSLASIIGWEGRESRGKGMCGTKGFVRQQNLTVLYRKHLQDGSSKRLCGKPSYITYRYYSQNNDENGHSDISLGEIIEILCEKEMSIIRCPTEGCEGLLQDHVHSWTCDDVTIEGHLSRQEDSFDTEKGIIAWQSCSICMQETSHKIIDAKSYLFSFAKYLEVLVWSPMIRSLSLCSHVNPTVWSDANETDARRIPYNIIYHFSYEGSILSFRPSRTRAFELQFPRLQFLSGSGSKEDKSSTHHYEKREKDELETQIEQWWQGICIRIDRLDDFFVKLTEMNKDLPPLPSSDDEDNGEDEEEETEEFNKKGFNLPLSPDTVGPPSSYSAFSQISLNNASSVSPSYILWSNLRSFGKTAPYPPSSPFRAIDSRVLLAELKASFRNSKERLKSQLCDTSLSSLNDARRNFKCIGRGILNRLYSWQKKHVPGASKDLLNGDNVLKDPEWWHNNCHAIPGGRVLVREGESGSIIAFTLSSLEYQRELSALSLPSGYSSSKQFDFESHYTLLSSSSRKSEKSSTTPSDPDFDDDYVSWSRIEPCITTVAKCKHSREESLLGFRDALRNTTSSESSGLNSRFGESIRPAGGTFASVPTSAWAQPQVQVSLDIADGELTQLSSGSKVMKEKVIDTPSSYIRPTTFTTSSQELQSQEYNGNARGRSALLQSEPVLITASTPVSRAGESAPTESNSLTDTLVGAVRHLFTSGQKPPSRAPSPVPSSTLHALLAYGSPYSVDEQPHIRYECIIGDRLQFSCIVYYAKQFDAIRKRCGVDSDIINSLQRSETWVAAGGKSKSNFWKTLDGKFVIKTLVNAWNVADLQVLIDLAPSYFRYIESTNAKASALTKLMGFYTVEVKDLGTGTVQAKHDVLVMENLFHGREISRIYDLKGIPGRKTKGKGDQTGHKTMHDGEWIEVQKENPLLLRGHSGYVLREGLGADAEFLAKSNIMDYSLLLGIDEVKCQIACGLVDTIGSYTFAKTLEYKAKHNLSTKGKEVTVIPPAEYQRRFTTALDGYFLICPDRWTKPQRYVDRTTPHDLSEVL